MEIIQIYHTNDLHSHLKRWPRIQRFLADRKKEHQEEKAEFFLFDIGDFIDRWHPLSEGTKGKGNVDLLNESHYTAITIGNNEGVNFPYEELDHLYEHAKFDVLAANLYSKDDRHPAWVKPYQIYHTKNGTRIGVIGLTAYFLQLYQLLGWQLTEPISELKKWLKQVQEQSDVIILLSHLGLHHDERIASDCPEIDVILGGHTHHRLPEGKIVGKSLLAAAGKYGQFVGQITIRVDDQHKITHKEAKLYDVMELPAVKDEEIKARQLFQKGKKLLNQEVISLSQPLVHDYYQETELAKILCRSLREWCDADCAFINAGLLLGPLSGKVTTYDLLSICPHPVNPCTVELTGKELTEVLLETRGDTWPHRPLKGLGFRGTVMGISVYDQISFKETDIFVNGLVVDLDKYYTLAIPDMFTFGHFFKEIFPNKQKNYFLPEFLRDLLKWKLISQSKM